MKLSNHRTRGYDGYSGGGRTQAFDAAGASGFAFLQGQLELIDTDLVEPLQAVTHPRDITVETGGGFPQFLSAWASNYATTGTSTIASFITTFDSPGDHHKLGEVFQFPYLKSAFLPLQLPSR